MRWLSLTLGASCCAGLFAACSLDDGGTANGVIDTDSGPGVDGGMMMAGDGAVGIDTGMTMHDAGPLPDVMAPPDVVWPCGVDPASCNDKTQVPTGWSPVAFALGQSSCPVDFGSPSTQGAEPSSAPSNACSCSISSTTPQQCKGSSTLMYDSTCSTTWPFSIAPTTCKKFTSLPAPSNISLSAITPSGGSCVQTATGAPVALDPALRCAPSICPEKICAGYAPTGWGACIATSGAVACPSGSMFQNRTVVGDSAAATCAACTDCTFSGGSCAGSFQYYNDDMCMNAVGNAITADGTCQAVGASGNVKGLSYSVTLTAGTANPGSSSPTGIFLSGPTTVCCR